MAGRIVQWALVAAACVPFVAAAQSGGAASVTFYGLIDVNLNQERAGGDRRTGVDHGELKGSRWGFRGREDLGSGLAAVFTLEGGFDPTVGGSEQGGRLFGRQSYVGLEGGFGRVTLGRQYSPAFVALDPLDATGSADRSAGLLTRKAGGVDPAYEVRFDNMVKYRSPEFAGFSADAGYWLGERGGSRGDARREGDGWGIAGLYRSGVVEAALVTQTVWRDATGGRVRTDGLGLAYDFGPVRAFAAATRDRESGSVGRGRARTWDVGAELRLPGPNTLALSYARRDESHDRAAEDAHGWSAYFLHDLSKRTTLYAAYSTLTNDGRANYALGNLRPDRGDDPSVVMAGVRHRF
ncbi:porin [Aromatoleum toluvorans]|uniref:Porin n=1 Tax=Aromatoleum toluvorans TaxID=92002 RepID=A0ABX1Q489_9RHOO|nr:porin [Aromatoleum toluvorans]NMG46178.1 porin [Aromatoleum toluvorans]